MIFWFFGVLPMVLLSYFSHGSDFLNFFGFTIGFASILEADGYLATCKLSKLDWLKTAVHRSTV